MYASRDSCNFSLKKEGIHYLWEIELAGATLRPPDMLLDSWLGRMIHTLWIGSTSLIEKARKPTGTDHSNGESGWLSQSIVASA